MVGRGGIYGDKYGDGRLVNEPREPTDPIPPFYVTKTLLGFDGEDLNRVTLQMPGDATFVLCEMGEPRTDDDRKRWNALAAALTKVWQKAHGL